MKLFEVTNDLVGESYVRCYVWAENRDIAHELAFVNRINFSTVAINHLARLQVKELFDQSESQFVSNWSDSGFER